MTSQAQYAALPNAGFFRRLAAFIYDFFMASAIALVMTMLSLALTAIANALGVISLPDGMEHSTYLTQQWWSQLLIWGGVVVFFIWFWTRAGQTIGMRAWRLRVQNKDGSNISISQACLRLFTAAFGLGNLMVLVTRENLAFQDLWARCVVVTLPKPNK
ncbi:RDD family protein [Aliagarivorans taiwanensis]|uniref:RDD family protein n=1 Tax=Aliagarivorans taiwanensis TaxID=561966 RepID=UPI00040499A1|nr:RDD family protein [Aliagarivorans taiwanensis]